MAETLYDMGELNISPGSILPVVYISQGDSGYNISFTLVKDGIVYTPSSDVTPYINGIKPDSTLFSYTATLVGSKVTFAITSQMSAVYGKVTCEISLKTTEGVTIGTVNFVILVEPSPYASTTNPSRSDIPSVNDVIDYSNKAAQYAEAAANSAAQAEKIVGNPVFTGATSDTDGSQGLVPTPSAGDNNKVLFGDGTWKSVSDSIAMISQVTNSSELVTISKDKEIVIASMDFTKTGKYIVLASIGVWIPSGTCATFRYSTTSGTSYEILGRTRSTVDAYSDGPNPDGNGVHHYTQLFTMTRVASTCTLSIKASTTADTGTVSYCGMGAFAIL